MWVWLVVRTETCSPSGPLAVEMTSYSAERTAASGTRRRAGAALLPTGGVVVRFFPVQDDEGRASFHRHHREVGGWRAWRRSHVHLAGFVLREVVEGGGDGARLVGFLARLVDDMRCLERRRSFVSRCPGSARLGSAGRRVHLPTYRFFPRASTSEDGCGLKSSESSQDSWRLAGETERTISAKVPVGISG